MAEKLCIVLVKVELSILFLLSSFVVWHTTVRRFNRQVWL